MAVLLAILLSLIIFTFLAANKLLPPKARVLLIILLFLALAWLHWSIAKTQLHTTGFAASNRVPNHAGQVLGFTFAAIGLIGALIAIKAIRISLILLILLIGALPFMYLSSW